eukprot:sb/3467109/
MAAGVPGGRGGRGNHAAGRGGMGRGGVGGMRGGMNQRGGRSMGRGGSTSKGKPDFTCANKHPIAALKSYKPTIEFTEVKQYSSKVGAAFIYTVTIEGTVYKGEATTPKTAKAIAATNAIKRCDRVIVVADYAKEAQMVQERIAASEAGGKGKRKASESGPGDNKKVKRDGVKDYGRLLQLYGPEIEESTIENKDAKTFSCTLKVQGFSFSGLSVSKKKARSIAVLSAFDEFEINPPPNIRSGTRVKSATGKDSTYSILVDLEKAYRKLSNSAKMKSLTLILLQNVCEFVTGHGTFLRVLIPHVKGPQDT